MRLVNIFIFLSYLKYLSKCYNFKQCRFKCQVIKNFRLFPATQNGLHCMYLNVVYSLYIFNLYRGSALLLTHEELLCSWGIELWITSQSNPIKKAPDRKCTHHQHACIYYTIYFNIKIHHTAFEHRQKQKAFCRILWDFSEDIKGLTVPKQSQTHCCS